MTVQAGIELDVDVAALVGEMPGIPCEHPFHDDDPAAHYGAATHYTRRDCQFCGSRTGLEATCAGFTQYIAEDLPMHCMDCGRGSAAHEVRKIVAPIQ